MANLANLEAPPKAVDLIIVDDDVPTWGGSWCQAGDWRWVLSHHVTYAPNRQGKWTYVPHDGELISFNTPRQACKEQWEFFHSLIVVGVAKKVQLPTQFLGVDSWHQ